MAFVDSRLNLAPSLLDRLLDDDPWVTTPLFTLHDLGNPEGLITKWREGEDAFSRFLYDQQPSDIQEILQSYSAGQPLTVELQEQLLGILNIFVDGECLYSPDRFQDITLAEETIRLLQDEPQGRGLMFLNRLLIEDVYPHHVRTRRVRDTSYTLAEFRQSISRDLEALLNTRQERLDDLPPQFKELPKSILLYGLPDFTARNLMDGLDRKDIRRSIEQTIKNFEPRLKSVSVSIDIPGGFEQALHFRIEAMLQLDPDPEAVMFDAVLRLDTTKYDVKGT